MIEDEELSALRKRAALVDDLATILHQYVCVDMGTGIRPAAVEVLARVGTWQTLIQMPPYPSHLVLDPSVKP